MISSMIERLRPPAVSVDEWLRVFILLRFTLFLFAFEMRREIALRFGLNISAKEYIVNSDYKQDQHPVMIQEHHLQGAWYRLH